LRPARALVSFSFLVLLPLLHAQTCSPTGTAPSVTICSPASGVTVSSPVTVVATANSTKTVLYSQIYIDGIKQYQVNGPNVNTQLAMTPGQHRLTVQSNDGSYFKATEYITVSDTSTGGSCSPSSSTPSVNICSPASGSTVASPVTISAAVHSANTVQYTQVYIDGVKQYQVNGSSVQTDLPLSAGQHRLTVSAYDGTTFWKTQYFTVGSGGGGGCTPGSTTPSVTICTPVSQATVDSPVTITATATSAKTIQFTEIYIDGIKKYQVNGSNINTQLTMSDGQHRLTVQAYDGSYFHTTEYITVNTGSGTPPPPPPSGDSSFTYKYDNMRSGLYSNETTLTTTNVNVNSFGKLGTWTLDGTSFTQPLYWSGLSITGKGTFNVLFVATEHDSVYALDANHPGSSPLWRKSFLVNGATTVPASSGGRTGLGTEVGITGTPVIDENTGTLYVSAMTLENNTPVHRLHALDVHTGNEKPNSPVKITATVNGIGVGHDANNQIKFNANTENQRAALLLLNGAVYVAFGAFSDIQPYHGWVFAFDAASLNQIAFWMATPDTEGGSVWQSGAGPAADTNGNIFVITADGTYQSGDLGDSFVKLKLNNGALQMVDYFTPYNEHCLNTDDLDLGSTGPLLVPDNATTRHLVIAGSKEGRIYVVDRDNMGHKQTGSDSQIVQSILVNPTACGTTGFNSSSSHRFYGGAGYWNGNVYLGSVFGPLFQYKINTDGTLTKVANGPTTYQASGQTGRGPIPMTSSNGNTNGIVWLVNRNYSTGNATLYAYDGTNISKLLYTSDQNGTRDAVGFGTGFSVPLVINGRLFINASKTIKVYGLLK
jgi:hypothetical protein